MSDTEKEQSGRPTEQTVEPEPLDGAMQLVLEKLQSDPLKIIAGLAQIEKHAGAQVILSVPSDEHHRKGALADFAKWWFGLDEASTPYHVSCAVEQFFDALMNKEQPHIDKLLRAVRTEYKSAEAVPVKGTNHYNKDLSRLDYRYIRRQRR